MNKKLVAAALGLAFAAPVFADSSNVTLYGRVHQAIEHNTRDIENANPATSGNGTNIADYSSRLGVRGVEDLGGGLSAIFAYEFGVDTDGLDNNAQSAAGGGGNTAMTTRHAYLGLKGSFGTLVIGSQDGGNDSQAPLYNQASAYMLNVNNNAGQLTVVNGNDAVINRVQRVGNAIGYATTVAGVKVSARHALTGTDQASGNDGTGALTTATGRAIENNTRESSIAADYTIGALTFGGGYTRIDGSDQFEQNQANGLTGLKSQIQFGARYNFGSFTLAGLVGQNKFRGARDSDNEIAISGLLPLNANSGIQALYAQAEAGREFDNGVVRQQSVAVGAQEIDNTQFQLSYYYDFSKRTRTYVGFNRTTRENSVLVGAAQTLRETDDDSFVVGLRHNF